MLTGAIRRSRPAILADRARAAATVSPAAGDAWGREQLRRRAADRCAPTSCLPASSGSRPARVAATATTGCWPAAGRRRAARCSPTIRTCRSSFRRSWYEMHLVAAGSRCDRRDDSRRAVRRARPQRAHCVGHDGDRRRRAGSGDRARRRRQEALDVPRRVGADRDRDRATFRCAAAARRCRSKSGRRATARSSRTSISDWEAPPSWLSPDGRPSDERARVFAAAGTPAAISRRRSRRSTAPATGRRSPTRSSRSPSPSMNIVYADVDGNIGYAMSGRLPVRAGGDGTLPAGRQLGAGVDGSIEPAALPRVFNPPSGLIYSANNEIDRGFSGLITRDWTARLPRLAAARSAVEGRRRRSRCDGRAAERSPQRRGRHRAGRARRGDQDRARARRRGRIGAGMLEQLAKWDRVVDCAAGGLALRSVRRRAVAAHVRRRDGRAAVPEVLRVGRRGEAGRAATRSSAIAIRRGGTTSRRWRSAKPATTFSCCAIRDADEQLQGDCGGESRARLGSRARGALQPSARRHRVSVPLVLDRGPVPVEGDGTTVMRISWNRLTPFAAWEYPSWRQLFDVGQWDDARVVAAGRPVGPPDEPVLFRSERDLAHRASTGRSRSPASAVTGGAREHRLLAGARNRLNSLNSEAL